MDSMLDDVVLVHKIVVMCYILLVIDIPVATISVVILPLSPKTGYLPGKY